jgi:steroid delta-isomerase-like uncharacterized protein
VIPLLSVEQNKAWVRRFMEEAFNKGNMNIIDELIAPGFVEHNPFPGQGAGIEGVRQLFAGLRTGFPDLHVVVDDIIAEGEKVVVLSTMKGTNKGSWMKMPPTGKQINVAGVDIVRISSGKAVEHWGVTDALTMMQQLGIVPQM